MSVNSSQPVKPPDISERKGKSSGNDFTEKTLYSKHGVMYYIV